MQNWKDEKNGRCEFRCGHQAAWCLVGKPRTSLFKFRLQGYSSDWKNIFNNPHWTVPVQNHGLWGIYLEMVVSSPRLELFNVVWILASNLKSIPATWIWIVMFWAFQLSTMQLDDHSLCPVDPVEHVSHAVEHVSEIYFSHRWYRCEMLRNVVSTVVQSDAQCQEESRRHRPIYSGIWSCHCGKKESAGRSPPGYMVPQILAFHFFSWDYV